MMADPYQVLGISRGASDEEIKKAYRTLSRRYHPDANINNPNKAQAEEKFKEVQMAYDRIMKERQSGSSGTDERYYRGGSSAASGDNGNTRLQAAANYIRNGYYREALNALDAIPFSERTARWYYYSAVAHNSVGNQATAINHIKRAVDLEPSNTQYRQFLQYMNSGGTWYQSMGGEYERPYSSAGRFCLSYFLLQFLCSCCCRPI